MMYKSIEKKFNRFYLLSKVTDFSNHSSTYIAWHMIDDRPSWAGFSCSGVPDYRANSRGCKSRKGQMFDESWIAVFKYL